MSLFKQIQEKLRLFNRRYYTNELIKGVILFVSLGLLYFFFTLFIEYFLWLKPTARTVLFWTFIMVELFLLIRFIGFPIFKIIGLQKGISEEECSKIIGNHFSEVKDKLLNVLQLQQNSTQSDLLLASIAQKSEELHLVPFSKAIDFKTNVKYLKYAIIPVLIWLISLFTGTNKQLSQSFNRVLNHNIAYQPPAPFTFRLTNNNLNVVQGKSLTIYVETKGDVTPQEAKIMYDDQQYFLQNEGDGLFSYTFSEVSNPISFYVEANKIQSQTYQITTIKTPTIQNIAMRLLYPRYLGKPNETIPNTGNVTVPQGTTIQWNVKTTQTDTVVFINNDKRHYFFKKNTNDFLFSKKILQNTNYQIASSNSTLKDYEQLQFSIETIKDEFPTISVTSNIDSISRGTAYFMGQLSDDYGISKLQLVYYSIQNPKKQLIKNISIGKQNVQTFFYEFPEKLVLNDGETYELYFQVFDNDAVTGSKKAVSQKFSYNQKTKQEIAEELLQEQKDNIDNLEKSLQRQQKSKRDLEKIQFDLQSKKTINWNDQKKIKNIIKRQEKYKQMMQRQADKLQENFDEKKEENESLQEKKEALKERIEELKKLEKQQKLLDELQKMAEKLNKEDLLKKAKELAEQNKQQERSLERILEMTKRFYVEQKTNQIANKLENLAKKQEELSKKESSKEEQNAIKKEFDKINQDLKQLQKENEKLKKPMSIPSMEELKRDTDKELNKASENIEKQNHQGAKENQKKARKNMQQMSKKMKKSMQQMSMDMAEENMEGLRQILENLITFSFKQEDLMTVFRKTSSSHPNFGNNLRKQHQLKTYFEHIDDSLFTLSMRVPKISAKIDEHLATAHYNLNQSLENFAESNFRRGVSNQQYVMTSANSLANMLSSTLDAMKNAKPGSGKGKGKKGESFSLPDIIQKQSDLLKKMQQGMKKKGDEGKKKNGKGEKDGKGKKNGKGKNGKSEQMNGELYQIYKEQAALRKQLEDALKSGKGNNGKTKKAIRDMENLEKEILEKGFNKNTIDRMQRLNYELLKLDKATFEQGRDKQRKSNTNLQEYQRNNNKKLEFKKRYYNQTEILNRQALPLQQIYKKKVQEYFKGI